MGEHRTWRLFRPNQPGFSRESPHHEFGLCYLAAVSDDSEIDDAALLDRWRGGEDEAGLRLHDRHGDAVIRFFRNKARDSAEDLVHETFVRLYESRDRIRESTRFRAYLLGIAHHVFHEHLRELGRGRKIDPEVESMRALDPGPSTIAARRREHRLLLEGLRHLSIEHQVVLELHYWEGLKSDEIAQIVAITPSAVRSRLAKARSLLADIITELGKSTALVASTLSGLEAWARELRGEFVAPRVREDESA